MKKKKLITKQLATTLQKCQITMKSEEMKTQVKLKKVQTLSTEERTLKVIAELKDNKATGFDKVITNIIDQNRNKLSLILTKLINGTVRNGRYPDIIILILQKRKQCASRNRPIGVLSTLNKILEETIQLQLTNYTNDNIVSKKKF